MHKDSERDQEPDVDGATEIHLDHLFPPEPEEEYPDDPHHEAKREQYHKHLQAHLHRLWPEKE